MVMEPTASVAWMHDGICEFWSPTAQTTNLLKGMSYCFGLSSEQVKVHRMQYVGGSFGLRGRVDADLEAAQLSRLVGAPVSLVRRREEDVQHGWYRPYQQSRLRAVIDASGRLTSWDQKTAQQGINTHYLDEFIPFGADMQRAYADLNKTVFYATPYDYFTVSGSPFGIASYTIPNARYETVKMFNAMPITHWRSVGFSGNTFQTESFIDEVAYAAGRDPLAVRRELCAGKPRALAVLDALAKAIAWRFPQRAGRNQGWGVAFSDGFETFSASAALVEVKGKQLRILRVVCVFDQGITVNTDQTEAQAQGGVIDGLAAALYGEITVADGRVVQSNLHDYPLLKMAQVPVIELHSIKSAERPGSVTEMITPLVVPALTNAIFAASGQRIRELPLKKAGFELSA
jgi:isoquinoline 1-oxidoreductase beta subunit